MHNKFEYVYPEEIKIKLPTMKKIGLPKKPELKNNG